MLVRSLPAIRIWQAVAVVAVLLLVATSWPRPVTHVTATQQAIEDVRRRVEYVSKVQPDQPPEFLVALAVNSYVVGHVSAPAYGYLHEIANADLPGGYSQAELVEETLAAGAGICGNASAVAQALYDAFGVRARTLQAWYATNDGPGVHVTTEVYYNDGWHWFDPTWGMFYRDPHAGWSDVASLADVLAMRRPERRGALVANESLLWTQTTRIGGHNSILSTGLGFLDADLLQVAEMGGRRLLYPANHP